MSTQGLATGRHETDEGGWLGLLAFVAMCIGVGAGLWWFTGPPTMFTSLPDWAYIREVLGSSDLRDRDVITVAAGAAWIVVGYVLLSVGVRMLVGIAFAITGGAAWARAALRVTTPLTIPVVRRMVDAALAGTIAVTVTLHAPSLASASGLSPAAAVEIRSSGLLGADLSAGMASGPASTPAFQAGPMTYTVVRGDHLWGIAERYLGDGFRWADIWRLNQQETMVDGLRFVDPNLIHPGWVLVLPDDAVVHAEPGPGAGDVDADEEPPGQPTPTATAEPDPTPLPPTPEPTHAVPSVTVSPSPASGASTDPVETESRDTDRRRPTVPDLPVAGAGVAAAAALGVSGAVMFLVARRFHAQRIASGDRTRRGRRGDAGRVLAMTAALASGLEELDFGESRILLARETEHYVEFTVRCPHGDEDALLAARHDLGRVLGCAFNGSLAEPGVVRLKLSRMSHLAMAIFAEKREHQPLLLPVGAADDGIYYLSLNAAGSVLLTGDRLETRELATSWLTTLATLYETADIAVVADGSIGEHLGETLDAVMNLHPSPDPVPKSGDFVQFLEEKLVAKDAEADQGVVLAFVGPDEDGVTLSMELEGVLRRGPALSVFTIALADETGPQGAVGRGFGAVIAVSTDEHGPLLTLTLSGIGALQLEPVVLRRLVAVRPPPQTDDLGEDAPEQPGDEDFADAFTADDDELTDENSRQDNSWAIGAEVELDPAAVTANGVHARSEVPVLPARGGGEEAMDRQASLPFAMTDEDTWEGPRFRVKLFGAFRIATDDEEIATWAIHKARELLAYLLVHGGSPVLRDTVSETLWPETNRKQAYHQLSNAAYTLRRTIAQALGNLEAQSLVILNQRYQLRPGLFRVDIDTFDAHLTRADSLQGHDALIEYERACRLYTAPLLIHEAWDWAGPYREDYRSRFIAAMKRAGALALTLRDPKLAVDFYNRILQQEPIEEEAVQGLMRSYGALGDVTGVKVAYRKLAEALQETLDDDSVEPLPLTVTVYRELLGRNGD